MKKQSVCVICGKVLSQFEESSRSSEPATCLDCYLYYRDLRGPIDKDKNKSNN